jgi:3',5'-cyclic-AMP phosphodiesterase
MPECGIASLWPQPACGAANPGCSRLSAGSFFNRTHGPAPVSYTIVLRIGWLTDLHLSFVSPRKRTTFYSRLRQQDLDAILLGGDIGEADSVPQFLAEIESSLQIPIYFVLGNHDFYGGSIAAVRAAVTRQAAASHWLRWLPASGVVHLTDATALVGHDSWADGRLGDFFRSAVLLNDYLLISELRGQEKRERYAQLNALGDEAAAFLERRASEALACRRNIIVLTHVPPFRESCWHEGRISDDDYLPHFACRAVGDRLAAIMQDHPGQTMTVLCGHTHSSGSARILGNLIVNTGQAQYGEPELQRVFELQ